MQTGAASAIQLNEMRGTMIQKLEQLLEKPLNIPDFIHDTYLDGKMCMTSSLRQSCFLSLIETFAAIPLK